MVSESLPTDGIESVAKTKHERLGINRLRKFGAYVTMIATVGTMTAIDAGQKIEAVSTLRTEIERYSNLNADLGQPMVILPEMCLDLDEPEHEPQQDIKTTDKKIETELSEEASTANLFAEPIEVEPESGWLEQVAGFGQNQIKQGEILAKQATGAIDTLNHLRYPRELYQSSLTRVEIVFSSKHEFELNPDNLQALETELLDPTNYFHSEQRQLIECVRRELVEKKTHENSRIHVIVGGPETMIKDFRIQPNSNTSQTEHGGAAIPINLVPLPASLKAEVLIIVTPSEGGEVKLNAMLAHELYHAYMHLIDLPIRMNPDERQAETAERFILRKWLNEARHVITYP